MNTRQWTVSSTCHTNSVFIYRYCYYTRIQYYVGAYSSFLWTRLVRYAYPIFFNRKIKTSAIFQQGSIHIIIQHDIISHLLQENISSPLYRSSRIREVFLNGGDDDVPSVKYMNIIKSVLFLTYFRSAT